MTHISEAEFREQLEASIPKIKSIARRMTRNPDDANDLVQNTVLAAWSKRHTFVPQRPLIAWLTVIMRNGFLSELRRQKNASHNMSRSRDVFWDLTGQDKLAVAPGSQDDHAYLREVLEAISTLSPIHQQILAMVMRGEKVEDMAAAAGIPEGTAKSRLFRARFELAMALGQEPVKIKTRRVG